MATVKGKNQGYSVNHQHDYSTLKTPYGNYTGSRYSEKLSGQLCVIKANLLDRYKKYTDSFVQEGKGNYGQAMESLMNEFTKVTPEVLALPKIEVIVAGDEVRFNEAMFIKKYPDAYIVYRTTPKTVFLEINGQRCGFDNYVLSKTGKTGYVKPAYVPPTISKDSKIIVTNNEQLGIFTVVEHSKAKTIIVDAYGKRYRFQPAKTKFTLA